MNNRTLRCWVDGQPTDHLDIRDRGLAYGDGLFETMALLGGRIAHEHHHYARLVAGCHRLGLPVPKFAQWQEHLAVALNHAPAEPAVLKLILTRGRGGRGYRSPQNPKPSWILQLLPWPDYPKSWAEQGITLRYCNSRLGHNPLLAGLKHLNRLEQVLARSEWDDTAIQEGLMLDLDGQVICGTQSNVFWVRHGQLYTPKLDRCGIAGITRARILEHFDVAIETISPADLEQADELFVCNSLMGVLPVINLAGQRYEIGPVTRAVQDALQKETV